MAESEESLHDKMVKWKHGMERKVLKMNAGKLKVMIGCTRTNKIEAKGK